jgi:GTPase
MGRRIPVVAIVGRTNVGKSTLFNQITGRHRSIVDNVSGVTRDRNYALVKKFLYPFTLVDTGGLIGEEDEQLAKSIRTQSELAISEADLILAVLDGLHGPHPHDEEVVNLLRQAGKPIVWVVNKCEKPEVELRASEFFGLGIDGLAAVSAAHNKGIHQLLDTIRTKLNLDQLASSEDAAPPPDLIRVAIVGKPNAGKSTFINKLLGESRLVTSELAGTTRDTIDVELVREGQRYVIVDTAGLRKKTKIGQGSLEKHSSLHALRALAACDVAVLMLDATLGPPTDQDTKIARLIHDRGRGLVIAVNKWDALEKDHRSAKEFKDRLFEEFKFAQYAPLLFVSAETGKRCPHVLRKVKDVHLAGQTRIQTSDLNRLLARAFEVKPPPVYRGEPAKLFFATQIDVAPPTFLLFVNQPEKVNLTYQRYLKNSIRKEYPFEGTELRLLFRKRTQKEESLRHD